MTLELLMQDNYKAGLAKGEAKGEAKAEAKYRAKAKEKEAQSVKNFYAQGLSIEAIAQGLSLTVAEVETIISAK